GGGPAGGVVAVGGLYAVDQVAAGGAHTCALDAAGQVWCWGSNEFGQLGGGPTGSGAAQAKPMLVAASAAKPKGALCGAPGFCDDGDPCTADTCNPVTGQCDHPPAKDGAPCGGSGSAKVCAAGACKTPWAVELALGFGFSCARKPSGAVYCWGSNGDGNLGAGLDTSKSSYIPIAVTGFGSGGAVSLAAADKQVCAVKTDGKVMCWGSSFSGALGNPAAAYSQTVPIEVVGLTDKVAVTVGTDGACAWNAAGALHCWGRNDKGQAGTGTVSSTSPTFYATPQAVAGGLGGVKAAVTGDVHTCAIGSGSKLWCWGEDSGALGLASPTGQSQPTPQQISLAPLVQSIAANAATTFVVDTSGIVRAWTGDANYGAPGHYLPSAAKSAAAVPVPVVGKATSLVARGGFVCAKLVDGRVACWGYNANGECTGNDKHALAARPAMLHGLVGAERIYAGKTHACALLGDGSLACWGDNYQGQYGNGAYNTTPPKGVTYVPGTGPGP
ncbi:MAG: hypothetical protein FJ100_15520, partial [Deltaproteobacteria bacterium]|nr:hypothetical protein [Deltaproteobacteria bacterium]